MPQQTYQAVIVTGINAGDEDSTEIVAAHHRARAVFEGDLVTDLTTIGHNFVQSFAVLPSGSGHGRDAQERHRKAIAEFTDWLSHTDLDYVAVRWGDVTGMPMITHSHEDRA